MVAFTVGDKKNLEAIEASLKCCICENLVTDPVFLKGCGHFLCTSCLYSNVASTNKNQCPHCQRICKQMDTSVPFMINSIICSFTKVEALICKMTDFQDRQFNQNCNDELKFDISSSKIPDTYQSSYSDLNVYIPGGYSNNDSMVSIHDCKSPSFEHQGVIEVPDSFIPWSESESVQIQENTTDCNAIPGFVTQSQSLPKLHFQNDTNCTTVIEIEKEKLDGGHHFSPQPTVVRDGLFTLTKNSNQLTQFHQISSHITSTDIYRDCHTKENDPNNHDRMEVNIETRRTFLNNPLHVNGDVDTCFESSNIAPQIEMMTSDPKKRSLDLFEYDQSLDTTKICKTDEIANTLIPGNQKSSDEDSCEDMIRRVSKIGFSPNLIRQLVLTYVSILYDTDVRVYTLNTAQTGDSCYVLQKGLANKLVISWHDGCFSL